MQNGARNKQSGLKCHGIGEHRKKVGREGERLAVEYLDRLKWQIVERNWRAGRYGEIDIVAVDPTECLVFIEVKARVASKFVQEQGFVTAGFEKLDWRKRAKLRTTASIYMARQGHQFNACRFDAIIVYLPLQFCACADNSREDDVGIKECLLDAEIQHVQAIF
jgi:putative endonuclease